MIASEASETEALRLPGADLAAQLTELYWMALMRDISLDHLHGAHPLVEEAVRDLSAMYGRQVRAQNLFRCGLLGEDAGPLVSQFLLHDTTSGTEPLLQKQFPYRSYEDHLKDYASWLAAQEGTPERSCAFESDRGKPVLRRISTLRDLARFVHTGSPHHAFATTAVLLESWGARTSPGNPFRGAPQLLALLMEAAACALEEAEAFQGHGVTPEAYAGCMHMQRRGLAGETQDYGLPEAVFTTEAARRIAAAGDWYLPVAYPEGSSGSPRPAAHAAVAGACATVLKAWFDEIQTIEELVSSKTPGARHPITGRPLRIVTPGLHPNGPPDGTGGAEPSTYAGDTSRMSVGSELNKLASNIAMARCMAGVSWRSDATRGLRLGEEVAIDVLEKLVKSNRLGLEATPVRLAFTSFDRDVIEVQKTAPGEARVLKNGRFI